MNCLFIPTHCAAHSAFLVYSDTNRQNRHFAFAWRAFAGN
jgi:hypothetical protein